MNWQTTARYASLILTLLIVSAFGDSEFLQNDTKPVQNLGQSNKTDLAEYQHQLTGVSPTASEPPASPPEPVWEVDESKSPVDDGPIVILSLAASEEPDGLSGSMALPALVIRCDEKQTDFYIAMNQYFGIFFSINPLTVIYRIDSQPSQTSGWAASTNGKSVFARDAISLARKVANASIFFARVSDPQGATYDLKFKVAGLNKVLPKVAAACGWNLP